MDRRIISVPKDKEAQAALDTDSAKPDQLIELRITDDEFNFLFSTGLLEKINQRCGCNIGDYESEEIVNQDSLEILSSVLEKASLNDKHSNLVSKLRNLAGEASSRNTGIFFFF